MESEFLKDVSAGDRFIAVETYEEAGETIIDVGQEWVVLETFELFAKIKHDDVEFWLGDNTFAQIFEKIE